MGLFRVLFLSIFYSLFCNFSYCGQDKPFTSTNEFLELLQKGSDTANEAIELFNKLRANFIAAANSACHFNEHQKIAYMESARRTVNKAREAEIEMNKILAMCVTDSIFGDLCKEYVAYLENLIDLSEESYRMFENPEKYYLKDPNLSKFMNCIVNNNIHAEKIKILNNKIENMPKQSEGL